MTYGSRARWWLASLLTLLVAAGSTGGCVVDLGDHGPHDEGTDASPSLSDASGGHTDALPLPPDAYVPIDLPAISFDHYHSQEEIADYLRAVADAAPNFTRFEVLGESSQGREIAVLVIDATGEEDPPALYANGTHHGDEKCGTEAALALIDYLLQHRADPDIAALLEAYAVYVQPLVNPDGHANNQRGDAYGRDPNRDYMIPGRDESEAFQLVETRLVRDLHDRVDIRASIAYHGGVEVILWPWGFTYDHTADHDLFNTLAKEGADAMGFDSYYESVELFPAEGEYSDFAYMSSQTLSITAEISEVKTPSTSDLATIVDRARRGSIAYLEAVRAYEAGELALEPEAYVHFGARGRVTIVDGEKRE